MGAVLVTGALGNVGGFVAEYLFQAGESVAVADIDVKALARRFGDRAICRFFDFTDASSHESALVDIDRVFLMRPPHLGHASDIDPFIQSMIRQGGIRLVCFLSLLGVERNPAPPHHWIERAIVRSGLPYSFVRPSFYMQNLSGVHAPEIRYFKKIVVPAGRALTSFIDARDVGALAAHVLGDSDKHRGQSYEVTGPEALDYHQVARMMSEELQIPIEYASPRPGFAKAYWNQVRGMPKAQATVMGLLYMMTRLGAARKTTGDFQRIMGRPPRSLREFIQENRTAWTE